MGGKGSGNWSVAKKFNALYMLESAAGVLINTFNISEREAHERHFFSELQIEKRRIALEVFKKLAPSSINVGGQEDNPIGLKLVQIILEAEDQVLKDEAMKNGKITGAVDAETVSSDPSATQQ